MLFILLMFSSCSLVLEISIQRENVTQKVRLQGPSYAGVYIQGRRGVKFSFSEKAKKIEKNLLLVLTLLSKNSCFGKTSGRFISKFVDFSQCFNCTQQQCGSMSKNHFAQFPDDRVHQKCKGKKLIMPDTLRIRCRTGIHIRTKACLKSFYANFTNTTFQKILIPHLKRTLKQKFLHLCGFYLILYLLICFT